LLALRHSDRRVAALLLPQLGAAHRLPEVMEACGDAALEILTMNHGDLIMRYGY